MLRNSRKVLLQNSVRPIIYHKKTFLTQEYKCTEAWKKMNSSPVFNKININDFYNVVDQNYTSKGVISAIDVDIFANAIKDSSHLEELKDMLHKLRLSAETGNMLESTRQATVRNYMEFGDINELVEILKNPLNFGVFLDYYSANILLDNLITTANYEQAARVAALMMLQEEYDNDITCTLCQYACLKYITNYVPPEPVPAPPEQKNKKVEEIKIRIKFLRNPYFDDHFDIQDTFTLSGKTLAWISERVKDNLSNNLQIIGWLIYRKFDKLSAFCETISKEKSFKVYAEVLKLLQRETGIVDAESKPVLENCLRNFSCLTNGDVIAIKYNSKVYELCVLETKPGNAVIIIECDMNVEFAPPVGYKEEERIPRGGEGGADASMDEDPSGMMPEPSGFVAFSGEGNRLDGKKKKLVSESESEPSASQSRQPYVRGIPDYDYVVGTLKFIRNSRPPSAKEETPSEPFTAFKGEGFTLRTAKSKN